MPKTLVTHNSRFHADDVFAAATLTILFPDARILRSRERSVLDSGDIVFDVGDVYDPTTLRFDHHQEGGAGKRDNNIPYAAFGLVWKEFGEKICGSKDIAEAIDKKVVQAIDAMDNGLDLYDPRIPGLFPYTFQTITFSCGPTWKEDPAETDQNFLKLVEFARMILQREIVQARDGLEAVTYVEKAYEDASDKRIIVLDDNYPWQTYLLTKIEPLYVLRKDIQSTNWKVEAVPAKTMSYELRKEMPKSWAGKRDGEFVKVSGVPDAVFCHNNLFLAVAKSKEGALRLAQIAVES